MKKHQTNSKYNGFTLVELAIAITIIGLLIGGVLKGQELLQSARMTRGLSQVKAYSAATTTFKDIYKAYPGDIVNPSNFIENCTTAPCNVSGNGNGQIGNDTNVISTAGDDENNNYWFHLLRANLVPSIGQTLTWSSGTYYASVQPAFALGGFSHLIYFNYVDAYIPQGKRGHYYLIYQPANSGASTSPAIPTPLIGKFDLKADDGRPLSGDIAVALTTCDVNPGDTTYNPNSATSCTYSIKADF